MKPSTKTFIWLIITAVLLGAFASPAFARDNRRRERQLTETERQAEALFQNALLLSDKQDSTSARLQLQQAMRLWTQMHKPGKAASAALLMGDRHKKAREYGDALNDYRLALKVDSIPGADKANALNAIALIYAELYLNDLALRYFTQALAQAHATGTVPARRLALTGLADLYRQQGAMDRALALIAEAERLGRQDHTVADPALVYLKGRISQTQGFPADAKAAFAEALEIYSGAGQVAGQVKTLCALSSLSMIALQKQTGLEQANRAVALADNQAKLAISHADFVNARDLRWRAWLTRARAERALGKSESARNSYKLAINHFEGMWWEFYAATEASAVAFREEAHSAYGEYVDLLMEQGQFKLAYQLADEAKARTLLTFAGARRAKPPSRDIKQAEALRELSRSIGRLRLKLTSGLSRERQAKLRADLEDAEYEIKEKRLQAEIAKAKDRMVWSELATAEKIEDQTVQAQMTLAEFSLGENRSFVWLFKHGEVFFQILPPRKEIEHAVRPFLEMLSATPNRLNIERDVAKLRDKSKALFDTLFGRLSSQLEPGQRLIIVPDGLLYYLPFEALTHNEHYLVEDHEISYLLSASMLLQQRQDSGTGAGTGDKMELLAFGDPVFRPDLNVSTTGKLASDPIAVMRSARASRGFQLPQLPRTRDEVQYITSLFPSDRTQLYLGKDSTEDALKQMSLRRYRRIHFATHSLIDETSPSRSAVVLTLDADPDEDGFLEVSEISELDLDCDLVVLSACQTGRGQLLSGEGIVGLSRAFLYAGAREVVVSLWNVTDISTGQLMKNLYRQLKAGASNAAALRETRLQMLKSDKESRHPYYWAPFVIIGKP